MTRLLSLLALLLFAAPLGPAPARAQDSMLTGQTVDDLVDECTGVAKERVVMLSDGETVCWTAAIFLPQFKEFEELIPKARRMIFSSRGGNVATAIAISDRLKDIDLPVIFAGQCISACASVILPGLENARVHRSAFFLIHGISSFDRKTFLADFIDRKSDIRAEGMARVQAALLSSYAWGYYSVQWPRTLDFLARRTIDAEYMKDPERRMQDSKDRLSCPLELFDYFASLDETHVRQFLGNRLAIIDDFIDERDELDDVTYLRRVSEDGVYVYRYRLRELGCQP